MDTLTINDVPIVCINKAALQYHIPATLIISVLRMENGHVGDAIPNKNGTFDYGPMQINTIWLHEIEKYGYTQQSVRYDPCVNVCVGAWILSKAIADDKTLWKGVGNYHSHTSDKNVVYRTKVEKIYTLLTKYLANPSQTPSRSFRLD